MRRNGLISLILIVVLSVGGLVGTFVADNEPLLGLDLQGGVSVVLQPTGEADSDAIGQAIEIIRQRVDGLGVAEPEIARQGDAIVIQLPGVQDRDRALELVGQTAELRFRPVLNVLPAGIGDLDLSGEVTTDGSTSTTLVDDGSTTDSTDPASTDSTDPDSTDPDSTDPDTTEPDPDLAPTETTVPSDESGFGFVEGEQALPAQTDEPAPSEESTTTTSTTPDASPATTAPDPSLDPFGLTPADEDVADATVILAQYEDDQEVLRYQLGPTLATGGILSGARADLQGLGTWYVAVDIAGSGLAQFNEIAAACFNRNNLCPSGQLAIVLDGRVVSAPTIQAPSFDSGGVSITGQFDESEARDLALVLRYGALPVELEAQQTQSVSATIGKDALDAGVTAGIVGLVLVAIYMVVYYRLLGVVALLSLSVSAALLWTVVAYLGENQGLALTLAGVTGIIVSIGIAVDSNVVFYEHLKEDVASGRQMRTVVDGSFASSFSTIVKADMASLIGAGILYWLTVGPVRGFAFYLGLSTILDLIAAYFFMRPATLMLVRSKALQDKPRLFGMPRTTTPTEASA